MHTPPLSVRFLLLNTLWLTFGGAVFLGQDARAATFHVSPKGPLRTVQAAIDGARKLETGKPRRIVVASGKYYLEQPIVLDARDNGLVIEAAEPGKAVLYGGRTITGWQPDGERFWAAPVPEAASGTWDFRLLVVNGRMATRARLPKEGRMKHLTKFDVPWMSTTLGGWKRKPTQEELTTLQYGPEDLGPWFNVRNAEVTVYHMWDESMVGVKAIDTAKHTLTFSSPCGHPPGAFQVRDYVVWNLREGMTEPGQWYLDRSAGKVVYWPRPGEDMTKATTLAPTMESIVRIPASEKNPVRDITLRGLTLAVTNTPLVAGGFGASKYAGAIVLTHANNCRLEQLTITNVAGQGVKAYKVQGLRVEDCEVHHTGASGLSIQGNGCVIRNNHVHHIGRMYPSAIGLTTGGRGGPGNLIAHNWIHDTPYSALTCGGDDHRIESNRISAAMQELHDGAGIYITFCKRVVVRGNFLHDILDTGGYGASAYYLDEQSEGCTVEGNLSVRVARPVHCHMAKKNAIVGNVFVCDGDAKMTFPRSSEHRLERNVLAAKGKIAIQNIGAITEAKDNLLFSTAGKTEGIVMDDYRTQATESLQAGKSWSFADPQLAEYESGKVRFAADSPAWKLGIEGLDVSEAGLRTRRP